MIRDTVVIAVLHPCRQTDGIKQKIKDSMSKVKVCGHQWKELVVVKQDLAQ